MNGLNLHLSISLLKLYKSCPIKKFQVTQKLSRYSHKSDYRTHDIIRYFLQAFAKFVSACTKDLWRNFTGKTKTTKNLDGFLSSAQIKLIKQLHAAPAVLLHIRGSKFPVSLYIYRILNEITRLMSHLNSRISMLSSSWAGLLLCCHHQRLCGRNKYCQWYCCPINLAQKASFHPKQILELQIFNNDYPCFKWESEGKWCPQVLGTKYSLW